MTAPDIPNLTDLTPLPLEPPLQNPSPSRATGLFSASAEEADRVVVKVWDALDADGRERFGREWRFVGILDGHPGIAKVHDGGGDDTRVWLVRDHVDGVSLADEIATTSPGTADTVTDRASHHLNAARVIAYAHRNGVSHGALKPTNIFRSTSGQAVITDFALPGVTDHTSTDRRDPAIAPWLAPEVGTAGRPSPTADVYALGAMLFAALTGAAPTGTEADAQAIRNLPGIGPQLAPLIAAATHRDPRHRPLNAGVYAEALARIVSVPAAGTTTSAPVDTPTPPSPGSDATAPARPTRPTRPTAMGASAAAASPRPSSPSRPAASSRSASSSRPPASYGPAMPSRDRTAADLRPSDPNQQRPVPGFTKPPTPQISDEQRRSRRTTVLAGVGLAAGVILVAFAWSFLVDLTRSDSSPIETASPAIEEPADSEPADSDAGDAEVDTDARGEDDEPRVSSTSIAQSDSADDERTPADRADAATASTSAATDGGSTTTESTGADSGASDSGATESATAESATADSASDDAAAAVEDTPVPAPTPRPTIDSRPAPAPAPAAPAPTQAPTTAPTAEPDPAGTDQAYRGARFTANLPDGWTPVSENRDVGYGYRTRFRGPDNDFLYIDLTPPTHHDGSETIEQSARRIAAQTPSAGPVVKLAIDDKTTWWFEYIGNDGSARIDVFFAIEDTGYAVVGGSHDDPGPAYEAVIEFVRTLQQV